MKKVVLLVVGALLVLSTQAQYVTKSAKVDLPKSKSVESSENLKSGGFKKYDFSIRFYDYCQAMIEKDKSYADSILSHYTFIEIKTGDVLEPDMDRWHFMSGAIWYDKGGELVDTTSIQYQRGIKAGLNMSKYKNATRLDLSGNGYNDIIPTCIIDYFNNLYKGKTYICDGIANGLISPTTKYKLTCTGVSLSDGYYYLKSNQPLMLCAMFDDIAVPINGIKADYNFISQFKEYFPTLGGTFRLIPVDKYKGELKTSVLPGEAATIARKAGAASSKLKVGKIEVGMTLEQARLIMTNTWYEIKSDGAKQGVDPRILALSGGGRVVIIEVDPSDKITKIYRDAVYYVGDVLR
ncbi:hypothetical protein QVO10_18305 [Bacteroides gallinaceum]|uniref:Uncharacterized protein n=1 Tax=Bacteroides gallinaceum TaxID=1462571 RepID=A0ABT7XB22_9BACE|nr:hypothetical protein [Bacteroides gallinaceum]MDN0051291.1 hypothetical protein [Bacteroides gallinaceum]